MEIRRVEPELITPAVASDHARRVEMERRPTGQHEGKRHRPHDAKEPPDEDAGEQAKSVITHLYDTEGHVQTCDPPGLETGTLDVTA